MRFLKSLSGLLVFTLIFQSVAWASADLSLSPSPFLKPSYEYNHYVVITGMTADTIRFFNNRISNVISSWSRDLTRF